MVWCRTAHYLILSSPSSLTHICVTHICGARDDELRCELYCSRCYDVFFNQLISPVQNGHLFADDIFRCTFVNEKVCSLIRISPKFVPKGLIDNKPALVKIMAWHRTGDKPLRPRQNGRQYPDDIFKYIFFMKMCKFPLRLHWSLFLRFK